MVRAGIFDAAGVYLKSGLVCLLVFLANFVIELRFKLVIPEQGVRWAVAFATVQVVSVISLTLYLLVSRAAARFLETVDEQLRPAIQDRVSALALAGETWSSPVPKHGPARRVLEESVAHALFQVKGTGRERLAQFALDQGFAANWAMALSSKSRKKRQRALSLLGSAPQLANCTDFSSALQDNHLGIRTEAARALFARGNSSEIDQVFRVVLGESLLTRALLASEMKRHSDTLLAHTIPSILAGADSTFATRCLEIVATWKLALTSFDAAQWLNSGSNRSVVLLQLKLMPYLPADDSIQDRLRCALESGDSEIQAAAAQAAGQLTLKDLIPTLATALHQEGQFAVASAAALARMGKPGQRVLEEAVNGSDRKAASLAIGALEHLAVGV